jgi:hypothetical protein
MRMELKTLRDRNLDEASFEERLDIISKLGIKVYPPEDLKSMRVLCSLTLIMCIQTAMVIEWNQGKFKPTGRASWR